MLLTFRNTWATVKMRQFAADGARRVLYYEEARRVRIPDYPQPLPATIYAQRSPIFLLKDIESAPSSGFQRKNKRALGTDRKNITTFAKMDAAFS